MREPDIRNVPIRDKELAMTTARVLSRVTGDKCAAQWNSVNDFTIVRQDPAGKAGKG